MLSGDTERHSLENELSDFSGKVISVTDGDTIKVMRNGEPVKVRLAGIDCPEKKQPYGMAAKRFAADWVAGETVRIESTGKEKGVKSTLDSYVAP